MDICHLSVLNPATHTRIFEKLACSQVRLGHRVSVVAQDTAPAPYAREGVQIIPLKPFGRLSLRRLWAIVWKIPEYALQSRAHVFVIHAPELLPIAWFFHFFYGKKIIYDVHEDYAANIRMATYYPAAVRIPLAWLVRRMEQHAVRWVEAVCYAELCYDNIVNAPAAKKFFLQNKVILPAALPPVSGEPYALLCGTLVPERGLWESIDVWEKMYPYFPLPLRIVGHTHRADVLAELQQRIAASPLAQQIQLVGGSHYVPHDELWAWIAGCTYSFALYREGAFRQGIIPTKFYECMAYQKPLIFTAENHWLALNAQVKFGVPMDAPEITAAALRQWLASPPHRAAEDWSWAAQEKILMEIF